MCVCVYTYVYTYIYVFVVVIVQSLSHPTVASLWSHGLQHASPPLSFTISQSLINFMAIESVMLSKHLILCCPLLLLPSIFPSIIWCNVELHIIPQKQYIKYSYIMYSLILVNLTECWAKKQLAGETVQYDIQGEFKSHETTGESQLMPIHALIVYRDVLILRKTSSSEK